MCEKETLCALQGFSSHDMFAHAHAHSLEGALLHIHLDTHTHKSTHSCTHTHTRVFMNGNCEFQTPYALCKNLLQSRTLSSSLLVYVFLDFGLASGRAQKR